MNAQSTLKAGLIVMGCLGSAATMVPHMANAQQAPSTPQLPEAPPATATNSKAPRGDIIAVGEIRLDGRITAMTGVDSFDISAVSFTTPAGKTVEFEEAKPKTVTFKNVKVLPGDDATREISLKEVKLGMRVAVIGKDGGSGKALNARVVVLNDFSSKYTVGRSEMMSAPVGMLYNRAQQAFQGRNFTLASRLFQQALAASAQFNDQRGRAAAFSGLGNTLSELGQAQKAMESFRSALKIREELDDNGGRAAVLNNMAMLSFQTKQMPQAIGFLERAVGMLADEPLDVQLVVRSNLANGYLQQDQFDKAYSALHALLPLSRAKGESSQLANILISLSAAAFKTGKTEESTRSIAEARTLFAAITDAEQRAAMLSLFGEYAKTIGDKAQAAAQWKQAATLYDGIGNPKAAAGIRLEIEKLDKPEDQPAADVAVPDAAATDENAVQN